MSVQKQRKFTIRTGQNLKAHVINAGGRVYGKGKGKITIVGIGGVGGYLSGIWQKPMKM